MCVGVGFEISSTLVVCIVLIEETTTGKKIKEGYDSYNMVPKVVGYFLRMINIT